MKQGWKIAIAFVVVFLAGGAIGSVFTLRYAGPRDAHWQQPVSGGFMP